MFLADHHPAAGPSSADENALVVTDDASNWWCFVNVCENVNTQQYNVEDLHTGVYVGVFSEVLAYFSKNWIKREVFGVFPV